jgi:Family of unknown function (DUF5329)
MNCLNTPAPVRGDCSLGAALAGVLLLCAFATAAVADVPESQRAEVVDLFAYVRASGCRIERNGKLYPAAEAEAHMQKKYQHFRDAIDSTEKFIELAASRSEVSGKPYLAQCNGRPPVPTRDWLLAELARFRAARR